MTSQIENYEPLQSLPTGVVPGINPDNEFTESSIVLIDQGDANPLENFSESSVVTLDGDPGIIENFSESSVVTVT